MFTPQLLLIAMAVLMLTMYLPAIVCPKKFRKELINMLADRNRTRLAGFIYMLISLFFLSVYWKIDKSWMTLVSVIGWGTLLEGVFLVWFPEKTKNLTKKFFSSDQSTIILAVIAIIFAIALLYITINLFQIGELISG